MNPRPVDPLPVDPLPAGPVLRVLEPGPLCLLQDLGRRTGLGMGLPRAGALDRASLRLANRLVGNPETAAGLELLGGGLVVQVMADTVLAFCGAPAPVLVDGRPEPSHTALPVRAGAQVRVGRPSHGLRVLLGVAGGLAGDLLAGSVSSSPTAGLGRAPLRAGDVLDSAGLATGPWTATDLGLAAAAVGGGSDGLMLGVFAGPRDDWFTPAARALFVATPWLVSPECDRVGMRLQARHHPAQVGLERLVTGELPSEAVIPGSVQVPPDGRPVVFLADHPTTGGYPVIGVVDPADLDVLGQVRPGDELRFEWRINPGLTKCRRVLL
ncbi:5-oxoprolinase subunit C [Aestuariimicrobium sp. T2.26MG-19.2B]|nr:5-oxoprolinase subunit C [Aestuariimicrobium sp. T2.26MG-19.2B]